MNKEPESQQQQVEHEKKCDTSTSETDATSRRELIQRYGKYALVAGPMLLFVSKANAIHSPP